MMMQAEREVDMRAQHVATAGTPGRVLTGEDHGSYGRGIYAGHSTFGLDLYTLGSYGRGIYARHSTFDLDFDTWGSYGRGIYASHSTYDRDFCRKDSYARGLEQLPGHVEERNTRAALQRTQH